jgi:hypothetical protein
MKNIVLWLRKTIYTIPGAQRFWIRLNKFIGRTKPTFSGWGMTTHTLTPWYNGGDEIAGDFLKANQMLITKVMQGEIKLSQFSKTKDIKMQLNRLMWRHYIVFWSSRYASQWTNCSIKNLVECGVCDGLTVYFAMSAMTGRNRYKTFLYDAWEGMISKYLLESEMEIVGAYSYLNIDNTKRNLAEFKEDVTFIKGIIPESFKTADNPTELVWLHIDLNSALPTIAALQLFYEKLLPGGIVLFDDYCWPESYDTKLAIDRFILSKRGILLPLPTGQAIFFKH